MQALLAFTYLRLLFCLSTHALDVGNDLFDSYVPKEIITLLRVIPIASSELVVAGELALPKRDPLLPADSEVAHMMSGAEESGAVNYRTPKGGGLPSLSSTDSRASGPVDNDPRCRSNV